MFRLIRNNLGNFLAICVLAILVFAGIFYYLSTNTKGAEIQQIKILPVSYSGNWQNSEATLAQDLGPDANFEEFNEENSAFPIEGYRIEEPAEIPTESGIQAGPPQFEDLGGEPIVSESESFQEEEVASPAEEAPIEEEAATESEELIILHPHIPFVLSVMMEARALFEDREIMASESLEEVIPDEVREETIIHEDVVSESASVGEEVIDFAPGFVESVLEFSGFDVSPSFVETSAGEKEIKNVQLRLSMAFEGGGPQDNLIIEYAYDSTDWNLLAELYLSDSNSNVTNGGYFLYALPIFENWEDLNKLKVRFKYRGILPDPMAPLSELNKPKGQVYLDALWLEVNYEEISDIKEKEKISKEKIIFEKSFGEFNVLKVEKENKKFELKFILNNDSGEFSLNFIADDSIIDFQSPIGSKFNYIFWLDKDKKGLYGFNIGTQAYNSISNNSGENNCLTFLDPASEKWQACYDETLNDFVFEPIIEIIATFETSSEILPESETLSEIQSEAPLETSSPENLIENLIKDVKNLIEENLPKDLF